MKNNLNFGPGNDPNKTVVHCPTQELAQKVFKFSNQPDEFIDIVSTQYGRHLCVSIKGGGCVAGYLNQFIKAGYTILPAEEFIRLNA